MNQAKQKDYMCYSSIYTQFEKIPPICGDKEQIVGWEMAWLVKGLSHKHDDLSSRPHYPLKSQVWWHACLCDPSSGEVEIGRCLECTDWPDPRGTLLHKGKWKAAREHPTLTPQAHTCVCTSASAHTHTQSSGVGVTKHHPVEVRLIKGHKKNLGC